VGATERRGGPVAACRGDGVTSPEGGCSSSPGICRGVCRSSETLSPVSATPGGGTGGGSPLYCQGRRPGPSCSVDQALARFATARNFERSRICGASDR
jgi:hypothetical protein